MIPETTNTESYAGTQSVVRALRLLKLFNSDASEWSLTELVEAAGLNKTTVFRLLTALESEQLLERTATGNYRLGSELIALGGRALRHHSLRQVAEPYLRQLAQESGERVTLELLSWPTAEVGAGMLVVEEIASPHLIGVTHYVGSRLPLAMTSTGKVLLAFLPVAEQEQLLAGLPTAVSAGLREQMPLIRAQGYAVAMGELEAGLMATAVPILNHLGYPAAAISVVGPSIRLTATDLHTVAQLAQRTAAVVSHQLGYRPA